MEELIAVLDNYTIYRVSDGKLGNYYLSVSNGNISKCQIYLGFTDKQTEILSKEEIVAMISEVNEIIQRENSDSIYIVPNIPQSLLEEATNENDNFMYTEILEQRIHPIILDVINNILVKNGVNVENINQVIKVIERNDQDKKLGGWLTTHPQIGSFVEEIDYNKLKEKDMMNNGNEVKKNDLEENNAHENQSVLSSGIAPVNHQYDEINYGSKSNQKTLKRTPPKSNNVSSGFSNFKFIIMTLLLSLVVGVSIGYLLIK